MKNKLIFLILLFFCVVFSSCSLSDGVDKTKPSLQVVLPGGTANRRSSVARSVDLSTLKFIIALEGKDYSKMIYASSGDTILFEALDYGKYTLQAGAFPVDDDNYQQLLYYGTKEVTIDSEEVKTVTLKLTAPGEVAIDEETLTITITPTTFTDCPVDFSSITDLTLSIGESHTFSLNLSTIPGATVQWLFSDDNLQANRLLSTDSSFELTAGGKYCWDDSDPDFPLYICFFPGTYALFVKVYYNSQCYSKFAYITITE